LPQKVRDHVEEIAGAGGPPGRPEMPQLCVIYLKDIVKGA